MSTAEFTYWPFAVLPLEQQTEEHQREIRFFEKAYQEGFKPCQSSFGYFKATSADGREGWIIQRGPSRGQRRWEVWLFAAETKKSSFWVDQFDSAAEAVLDWLRGHEVKTVIAAQRPEEITK
jgi:hypothetical protein